MAVMTALFVFIAALLEVQEATVYCILRWSATAAGVPQRRATNRRETTLD
jgi:hypothetical protein